MEWDYFTTILLPVIILIYLNPKWRRIVKCYGKYVIYFLHLGMISILGFPFCYKHPVNCKSMWIFTRLMNPISKVLGVHFEVRRPEKMLGNDKSAVCIANHQTMFDVQGVAFLWETFSLRMGIIARNFFFWMWPFGLALWMGGTVFIKRQSGSEKTKECFNNAAQQLFDKQEKLLVFVEGTRNNNSETLLPFKKGAFIVAITSQVPLQPIVLSPHYFINFKDKRFDSGKILIEIMDPIPTEGLTLDDLDDLIARTHALMSEKFNELRNEMKPYIEAYKNSITD